MHVTRLRQVVVAAADCDATIAAARTAFGLGEPFPDPGVGEFGLRNGVLPVGDQFLEVVSPTQPKTAAGRWMEKAGGDAGYMVIFQVADIAEARAHLAACELPTVWSGDFPDISGTHIHPAKIGGAIVSIDEPRPPATWRWGGPSWGDNVRTDVVTGVAGITMADDDPTALRDRWGRALALTPDDKGDFVLLDGSVVAFVASSAAGGRKGLVQIDLTATNPSNRGTTHEIAGTTFRLV